MAFMWILGIVVYLVIGGIIHAVIPDKDDELAGIIVAWPIALIVMILVGIVLAVKAFGYFIVEMCKQFFCKGEEQK